MLELARPAARWSGPRITVAIINGQPLARAGLEHLLGRHAGCEVVLSSATVEDFDAAGVRPGVVVMDLDAAPYQALDTVSGLSRHSGVLVTCEPSDPRLPGALRAGACGCVSRTADGEVIGAAVRAVAAGALYICPRLAGQLRGQMGGQMGGPAARSEPGTWAERRPVAPDAPGLTPREIQALRMVADGLTHAQIARRMQLSVSTVNYYVNRVRAKLNVGNKAQLAVKAMALGYLRSGDAA